MVSRRGIRGKGRTLVYWPGLGVKRMRVLILGGSGFVSGTLARRALAEGHTVTTVTRGRAPVPDGTAAIIVDRKDRTAFAERFVRERGRWDLAIDVICYEPDDMRQDLEVIAPRTDHFVFVSTDFVYSPDARRIPQDETNATYTTTGYGADKRACEVLLEDGAPDGLSWTVFRPNHIYGPGSLLGCLPEHARDAELIDRIRADEPLRLVGGGIHLQQPVLADDLARLFLAQPTAPACAGRIFNACGPDTVESREYYEIIAERLGKDLRIEEIPVRKYLDREPQKAPFICHRVYDRSSLLDAGLPAPDTPLKTGLHTHVDAILAESGG